MWNRHPTLSSGKSPVVVPVMGQPVEKVPGLQFRALRASVAALYRAENLLKSRCCDLLRPPLWAPARFFQQAGALWEPESLPATIGGLRVSELVGVPGKRADDSGTGSESATHA